MKKDLRNENCFQSKWARDDGRFLHGVQFAIMAFLLFSTILLNASVRPQNEKVTISLEDATIKTLFNEIQKQTAINFIYNEEQTKDLRINVNVKNEPVTDLLTTVLSKHGMTYSYDNQLIVVYVKGDTLQAIQEQAKVLKVEGVVVDEDGQTLPGVSVLVKETTVGVATDINGKFKINVLPNTTLVFSFVGKKAKEVKVISEKPIKVVLATETKVMQEVVVNGYQTLSKERATGSFETIGTAQLDKPQTSLESSLVGNVSGLYVNKKEQFIIRGLTSLGADANPLVIVDGFAIEGNISSINPNDVASITILKDAAAASIWGARSANGVIVVTTKSAQKGKVNVDINAFVRMSEKLDLSYANPKATSAETIEYEKMGFDSQFFNSGRAYIADSYNQSLYYTYGPLYSTATVQMNEARLGYIKDLDQRLAQLSKVNNKGQIKKYLLNKPIVQQYNLIISGGTDKLNTILTLMYQKDVTTFKGNDNQKYSIDHRTQLAMFKWLDITTSISFQYNKSNMNGVSLSDIQEMSPYDLLLNKDDSYTHVQKDLYLPVIERTLKQSGLQFPYDDWTYNPLREQRSRNNVEQNIDGRLQLGLTFKLLKGLSLESKFQYELDKGNIKDQYLEDSYQVRFNVNYLSQWNGNADSPVIQNIAKGAALQESNTDLNAYNFRNQLNFNRTFFDKHDVSFLLGSEFSERIYETSSMPIIYGYNDNLLSFTPPLNGITTPENPCYNMFGNEDYEGINYPTPYRSYNNDRFISIYSNIGYTYDDKYSISASIRTDASNLISSDNSIRYAPFWSIGVSWQLGKENFIKEYEAINRLVLRATYGMAGNVDKSTSVDPLISVWGMSSQTGTGFGVISNFGNPKLGWEKTSSINIGLDFDFWNGRIIGSFDYYNKKGHDLISTVSIASLYGTDSQKINAVEMYNKGVELNLGTRLNAGNFIFTGNMNVAYNSNKITKLYKDRSTLCYRIYGPGSGWEYCEGYDASTLWQYTYGGMKTYGDSQEPVILDNKGENPRTMNQPDYSQDNYDYLSSAGKSIPPYICGFTGTVGYRNLSFSWIVNGYFGHVFKRVNFNYPTMSKGRGDINKYYSDIKNCNPMKTVPLPSQMGGRYPRYLSSYLGVIDYNYVNAGNIRLQELNLTYKLPKNWCQRISANSLSLFAQVNNVGVLLFNKYKQDPFYPMGTAKPGTSYTIGCKLNF